MGELTHIQSIIKDELKIFDDQFSRNIKTNIPLLNIITNYLIRRKGKQIRPLLVFLTAKLLGNINNSTYTAASLVELLHTATLIHDDVVDESYERRGFFSINALWKSKIAVLLGDFLLAKGLLIAVENKEYDILEIVSNAVREMSEGELLQIQKSRKLDLTEEEYFEIIKKKTATLIASCTACGARSVTLDVSNISKMKEFGTYLGIAFQIKDDLFDYEKTSITGKPIGNDIQEKKLTLPLIASFYQAPKNEKKEIIKIINTKSNKRKTFNRVYDFVHKYNGVEYSKIKLNYYRDEALKVLFTFEKNEARDSLEVLVNYVVNRKS
jgi:octaprenyl-diphosphate synthase